jgi:hypothetical protein
VPPPLPLPLRPSVEDFRWSLTSPTGVCPPRPEGRRRWRLRHETGRDDAQRRACSCRARRWKIAMVACFWLSYTFIEQERVVCFVHTER